MFVRRSILVHRIISDYFTLMSNIEIIQIHVRERHLCFLNGRIVIHNNGTLHRHAPDKKS